jgi:two-component system response regulator DctR
MIMHKKIRILAIDDEPDILYTLKAVGSSMGWDVQTEADSTKGCQAFKALKPDLVLVDYHMPQQDGLVTVRLLRQMDRLVPIIVLTVDENQAIADRFLNAGANDFANKPIKVPDLAARINVHIQLLRKQHELEAGCQATKGINDCTLRLIYEYCQAQNDWFTIEDAVESVGLAYQTTVRYLQYLLNKKELVVMSYYGKVGRPRNKYKFAAR